MSKLFITYCLSAILVSLPGCHSASDSCTLPAPERITFTGVGTHGIFDPAITLNPVDNRLWMSYSAVDASAQWPVQNFDVVSTRLAYSDDNGNSWTDTGAVINNVLDVTLPLTPPFDAGTWINEVSQLIYDPGAIAGERWKLLWHHYLLINGERHFEHGWIGLKMADSPENLAAATEIKLFGSYLYDTGNNIAGGASGSPVGGAPLIQLDTALSSALNTCVFTEPGMYATGNALYLALQCVRLADSEHLIVLLKCASPCNTGNAASWSYLGTALQNADAAALGFDSGFAAPGLFAASGNLYLVVTPVQTGGAPWADYYSGCRVFRFADIETATLESSGSQPVVMDSVDGMAGSFNGACSYHASANNSGMLYSQLMNSVTDRFQIYMSHMNF